MRTAQCLFFSLDRQYQALSNYVEPDRYRFFESLRAEGGPLIPRGAGLSYVAASFGANGTSIGLKNFNRILAFENSQSGAITITVESGISLHKLHLFLAPQGLCVPVEPGHPQITIGGCIAFNVFGKNQFREGFFDSCVEELELFHPAKGYLTCSRSKNPDIFHLTCGGMGLTGIILKARIRLKKIPSAWLDVEKIPVKNLHEMVEVMARIRESADSLYSFNDFTSFGDNIGAGFVLSANFTREDAAVEPLRKFKPLDRLPTRAFNRFNFATRPAFCLAYRALNTTLKRKERTPFFRFNYPVAETPFYFDWYGKKGFVERQLLVPTNRIPVYLDRFGNLLRKHKPRIVFGSCKLFAGERKFLKFAGDGLVISLDLVPSASEEKFHRELDELNVELGALDNISKDSRMSAQLVRAQYPNAGRFREQLNAFDSNRCFTSALSERLAI